jgi:UDP-N-acetylglucosamine--N-acetylmuramyl-(pentapeptide) pyrophosphoryl-undecaprenol N-acetylglucosamine transferase
MQLQHRHIIISGGGTGGHIFPALAIANALRDKLSESKILFIGSKGKMEMEKVPAAGYPIEGLWISGLKRKFTLENLSFPFKIISSLFRAWRIIRRFRPDVVAGVGGYASGPTLRMASIMGIPTLIQEQNSFPGITNKLLARSVDRICVAYPGMDKYFPAEKITRTGNPIRQEILDIDGKREKAAKYFNLQPDLKTVLVIGGSQGAVSINRSIEEILPMVRDASIQLIWQTGNTYFEKASEAAMRLSYEGLHVTEFIQPMDLAYAMADLVISRAGAIAISELSALGKPVIFIPLPTAAEDHQMKNALSLAENNAALVIRDDEAGEKLGNLLMDLIKNEKKQEELRENISAFAVLDADKRIAEEIIQLMERK